jgi:hypothetical protein
MLLLVVVALSCILLTSGLSPVVASATASLNVLPGSAASAYGYHDHIRKIPRSYFWLILPCFIGSIGGNYLLIHTKPHIFAKLAPWFVLSAVALLAVQSRLHRWLTQQTKKRKIHWHTLPLLCLFALPISLYCGFFGVGYGIMMLALLGFTALTSIHQMNGLRNCCGVVMSAGSVMYLGHAGLLHWQSGLVMACGTTLGGYTGSRLSQQVSAHVVHDITIVIGLIISIVLLVKQ